MQQGMNAAARIGKSHFDVMGLARTPGGLVASGHPGAGEEPVNDLGLRARAMKEKHGRTFRS
jgi:hypothetical protein